VRLHTRRTTTATADLAAKKQKARSPPKLLCNVREQLVVLGGLVVFVAKL